MLNDVVLPFYAGSDQQVQSAGIIYKLHMYIEISLIVHVFVIENLVYAFVENIRSKPENSTGFTIRK